MMRGPAEVRAAKHAAMGPQLGELHYQLREEVVSLHLQWNEFIVLYGTDPNSIEVMNKTAPSFFSRLQHSMWANVLLHLCRVTDSPVSAGKKTLSVRALPDFCDDAQHKDKVFALLKDVVTSTEFARDWRNRRLAHRELPPLDGQPAQPLAVANRRLVDSALAAVRGVMDCVELKYEDSTTVYQYSNQSVGGSSHLLYFLGKGLGQTRTA